MVLTPKRVERLAHALAACGDRDVTAAIGEYDPESRLAIRLAIQAARESRGISRDGRPPRCPAYAWASKMAAIG
jgi:hypothetical protein